MNSVKLNPITLKHMYEMEQKSIKQIAEELGTYPNKIRRVLIKSNVKIRDRGESTSVAIKSGRKKHPTEGKKRDETTKIKISESRAKKWEELTSEELERIKISCKQRWDDIPDSKKVAMRKSASLAVRETAKSGSQLEKYLHKALIEQGYGCFHHKKITENQNLEVDLLIPAIRLAIEVDGPSHYLPIWGDEALEKAISADQEKNGLLTLAKYSVLRLRCAKKSMSDKIKRDSLSIVMNVVHEVEKQNNYSVIQVEVE